MAGGWCGIGSSRVVDVRYRRCTYRHLQCAGRRRSAIAPPRITKVKQKMTGHSGPTVLSKKPKNQPQNTVLIPLTKSRIPATEPSDLPALSLPIAKHAAKIRERPMLL